MSGAHHTMCQYRFTYSSYKLVTFRALDVPYPSNARTHKNENYCKRRAWWYVDVSSTASTIVALYSSSTVQYRTV